ncbi:MAG: methyltransferase domain-containing protein [Clostridia bacterium]|nr:methyltransferase domain-containing protein [Clostridia bacterium]MBQ8446913.1 methyltransferase domain-containing protein [Clostridia bacterium]
MLTNPVYDPFQILTKIYSDGAHVKQAIADTYIEEQYRSRTVKIVYGVLENDGYFDYCIRFYAPKAPKLAVRTILKISLYMLLFMDKKRYMITDCAVDLCKKLGKSGVSGFVNAFLRRFDKNAVDGGLPKGLQGRAIALSYPQFALEMLVKEYGKRAEQIAAAKSAGVSVRFVKNAEKYTQKPHIKTPFDGNYIFENFVRDEGFDDGEYTFQSVGSIAICDCVSPCESLLDCCAAPGGKSVLLAAKCGQVTSFELHEHRVELIGQYKRRMHVENVTELQKDSSVFDKQYEEKFDAVLCDAPCSGYGTISENPDIKLFRKKEDFAALAKTQRAILDAVCRYVKKGGALYYSTCSLFQCENDETVEAFLKNHPEFTVETLQSPLSHDCKKYGLQFLPDTAYGAGFYISKLIKKS